MKRYDDCLRKRRSRETVIRLYREFMGLDRIPEGQQYWTLCGPLSTPEGVLSPGCELEHVLGSKLLRSPSQFHGVERDREIHRTNVRAVAQKYPQADRPNLYHGDIYDVLNQKLGDETFRPAVVNLDSLHEPERAVSLLGRVVYLLNHVPGRKLVVLNVIIEQHLYGRNYTEEDIGKEIKANDFAFDALERGNWQQCDHCYEYGGTGWSGTRMCTLFFVQPLLEAAVA